MSFGTHMQAFLLPQKYIAVELLVHKVCNSSILFNMRNCFQRGHSNVHYHQQCGEFLLLHVVIDKRLLAEWPRPHPSSTLGRKLIPAETLKCKIQWLLVYSRSCAPITTINFRIFITPKENLHTLVVIPYLLHPPIPRQPVIYCLSLGLPSLDIPYISGIM